jgi:uncharacterized protein YbaR (Trm112 family)
MLELLRCPCPKHASLTFRPAADQDPVSEEELVCDECRRAFPIRDGFPVMLLDEASDPGD